MANAQKSSEDIEVFFSYSHEDEKLRDELEKHLSILKRLGLISTWYDRKIGAGNEWKGQIDNHLNSAHIILILISPDFLSSDYCYDIEMLRAIERHDLGEARVIPVILRPVDWRGAPFGKLQALPANAEPVISKNWGSLDDAFYDIAKGIRKEVESLKSVSITPKPVHQNQTIIVDQMHRGDYSSIAQAVEASEPGDCILVRYGLYQECVVIDKPLEIIGEGERNEIEIRAKDNNTITFKTNYGKIANLTLRQMSPGNELACISIHSGRFIIEECDISSQSDAAIVIHKDADPRLRKNTINDCIGIGVLIVNGGQGLLEENQLLRNSTSISIKDNSRPTLRRNIINLNRGDGIVISDNCRGILEENIILNNVGKGVVIRSGSNPILRNNKIHDNISDGIHIIENASGTLEENDIFRNNKGIYIEDSNPILRKNIIHEGKDYGLDVYDGSRVILIEDNDIFSNNGEISVYGWGNAVIRHNKIHGSKLWGVYVKSYVQCTLENNDIFENNYYGVTISPNANPVLRHNRIYKNTWGVEVSDGGCGTFEYNDLRNNEHGAWKISDDTKSKIKSVLNQDV